MLTDTSKYTEGCHFPSATRNFRCAREGNASGTANQSPQPDLVSDSDTELSYCQGSLQAEAEAADQGSSPAG